MIKAAVVFNMTPSRVVYGYQRSGRVCCLLQRSLKQWSTLHCSETKALNSWEIPACYMYHMAGIFNRHLAAVNIPSHCSGVPCCPWTYVSLTTVYFPADKWEQLITVTRPAICSSWFRLLSSHYNHFVDDCHWEVYEHLGRLTTDFCFNTVNNKMVVVSFCCRLQYAFIFMECIFVFKLVTLLIFCNSAQLIHETMDIAAFPTKSYYFNLNSIF
jgi:hypothetical protein